MKHWLIQRGFIKTDKRSQIQGIDSLIRFDYMGAAEFEFGALPKALKGIIANLDRLEVHLVDDLRKNGARLAIIATKDQVADVEKFFRSQAADPYAIRLKERTEFKQTIDRAADAPPIQRHEYKSEVNFWWDITEGEFDTSNNWMATFGKENADNILLALRKTKEKKGW